MNAVSRGARAALVVVLVAVGLVLPSSPAGAGPSVDVHAFGGAPAWGAPDVALNGAVVDMASHPTANGYWLLGRDGGVFSYGVPFFGSTGGMRLNRPVVAMAATPDGNGYWFVAEDGGVFSFGSAQFHGSTGGIRLNSRVVGMAATPTGGGYWLVAEDGGIFAFGDATFHGSNGGVWTGTPVVAMTPSAAGHGYVMLGANGTLFSFGDAPAYPSHLLPQGAADVTLTRTGGGVWVVARDGALYTYGDAPYLGGANTTERHAAAIAAAAGGGYWVAMVPKPPSGPPAPPNSGEGRRIVYSNSGQRVWLVESDNHYSATFPVSGRRGVPAPGTYHVFSKSVMSTAHGGDLRLPYMTRFARASSGLAIGFHGIPLRGNGTPIQSDAELGEFRSAGCVRMNQNDIRVLYNWAPIGTKVVVLP
jgi:hypothetical protein